MCSLNGGECCIKCISKEIEVRSAPARASAPTSMLGIFEAKREKGEITCGSCDKNLKGESSGFFCKLCDERMRALEKKGALFTDGVTRHEELTSKIFAEMRALSPLVGTRHLVICGKCGGIKNSPTAVCAKCEKPASTAACRGCAHALPADATSPFCDGCCASGVATRDERPKILEKKTTLHEFPSPNRGRESIQTFEEMRALAPQVGTEAIVTCPTCCRLKESAAALCKACEETHNADEKRRKARYTLQVFEEKRAEARRKLIC